MAQDIEDTFSDCSYERLSPISECEEAGTAVCLDDEDGQMICVAHDTSSISGPSKARMESERLKQTEGNISDAWKKDNMFFFSFVTFRVEEQLFRVPRDAFENQSRYFRTLFASKGPGDILEPIFLEGIEKDAFRDLLWLLYPPPLSSSSTGLLLLARAVLLTGEEWIKVLELAQKWDLTGIQTYAIERLEGIKIEEVQKLKLAIKYDIEHWHADAFNALVKRQEPLSVEEGQRLGIDLTLEIANARERRLSRLIKAQQRQPIASTSMINDVSDAFAPLYQSSRGNSHSEQHPDTDSAREIRAKKRATVAITGDRRELWGPRELMRKESSVNQGSTLTLAVHGDTEFQRFPGVNGLQIPRTASPNLGTGTSGFRTPALPTLKLPVPHLEIKKRHRLSAPVFTSRN